MSSNPYESYFENSLLSATPIEGVRMLYEGAIAHIEDARRHLAEKNIRARSTSISRAVEILVELSASLDYDRGGDLSARLAAIYDYIQRRLLQANFEQSDAPLAESIQLLGTLLDAWKSLSVEPAVAPAATAAVA